jgi:chemotaxis protein CheX
MQEQKLQVFIDGAMHYFRQVNANDVDVGTPYLADNNSPAAFDFTGIIGISGPNKGCVYFTAPSALLKHLLFSLGESNTQEEYLRDLVGEVANTISGNARNEYGSEFMISVPVVMQGIPDGIYLHREQRSYVIPIYWKAYSAAIVICLK